MGGRSGGSVRRGRGEGGEEESSAEWQRKGATLSHNTACREYGLTWEEIVVGIRAGILQYREGSMHGNPFLRLLRREVETLVRTTRGADEVREQRLRTEVASLDREIRSHRRKITALEARRSRLLEEHGESGNSD